MRFARSRPRLPIGIQSFRKLREEDYYYVDKTGFALQLIREGTHYFLSRPRRFGKSLFLSMLRELFEGRRELFEGLQAQRRWDWSVRYPVLLLSFGRRSYFRPEHIERTLAAQLQGYEQRANLGPIFESAPERLANLLENLHEQTGRRVVVLVDEYDKPILDALDEPGMARANRDLLRGLYSVIRDCHDHVQFCFLTGVSKFSKVSLFSGLNNLEDITLDPTFSSICGYAESDLDLVFADRIEGLDRERVREWYNGYGWGAAERVYNPFDVLLLLKRRTFQPWWYETATPTFLIDLLAEKRFPWHRLDGLLASDEILSRFDVGDIAPEALAFQSGYLTIVERRDLDDGPAYRLGFPNREVRQSLNRALLATLPSADGEREAERRRLSEVLKTGDIAGLENRLRALLAGIPYQWHRQNPMGSFEGWYASLLYAYFAATGAEVRAEESSSLGRADLCVRAFRRVYVFEFKMRERAGAGAAMAQLKTRGYADRYRGRGEPIQLVAVEFSAKTRNVTRFEAELA